MSVVALLTSIIFSFRSNQLAKDANRIAKDAKAISEESLKFEMDKRSQEYVENVFSEIYQVNKNLNTIQKLRNQEYIGNKSDIDPVVDLLEGAGNSFCQGTVWRWHLNTILKKTLSDVCENEEIYNIYSYEKNGLAMLCKEFFPNSIFSKTLQIENLSTCKFYDSSELKPIIILQKNN